MNGAIMNFVSMNFIPLLFQRFGEIYGVRAGLIEGSRVEWGKVICGSSGEEIKKALDSCREDPTILVTLELFAELLGKKPKFHISDNKDGYCKAKEVPISHSYSRSELLSMDEQTASVKLTGEQYYDRTRLILEQQAIEQCRRNGVSEKKDPLPGPSPTVTAPKEIKKEIKYVGRDLY